MSAAEQLDFPVETSDSNVVSIMGRGGFGGEGSRTPFPPDRSSKEEVGSEDQTPVQEEPKQKKNVTWDAAVDVLGYEPRTASEKALWGKMTSSLNSAGATDEQIHQVAEWYHRHWPGIDLTITALEKWFSHFLAKAEKRAKAKANTATCPVCEVGGGRHSADCSAAK